MQKPTGWNFGFSKIPKLKEKELLHYLPRPLLPSYNNQNWQDEEEGKKVMYKTSRIASTCSVFSCQENSMWAPGNHAALHGGTGEGSLQLRTV